MTGLKRIVFFAAASLAVACNDNVLAPTDPEPTAVRLGTGDLALATTTTEDGLSISTDKDDYQPGDVVRLTGSGWPAADVLDILLEDEPATHEPHQWTVSTDEAGVFHDSTYVVDAGDLDVTFTLTATSRATGRSLSVRFTDANINNNGVAVSPGIVGVVRGDPASYSVSISFGGNTTPCTSPLSITGLPQGAAGTLNPSSVTGVGGDVRQSALTITTTATGPTTTPAGSFTFTVRAATPSDQGCDGVDRAGTGVLVVSGPANNLAFAQQPANRQATQPFSPALTVRVRDAANNLVAASSASITLAIGNNPGSGTLSGGALTQNAVLGVATFPGLSIDKIGTGYTLTASSLDLTGATSNSFNVTLGPAARLVFTSQPSGGEPNTAFQGQPAVGVQDAGGNTITTGAGNNASISLAIVSGPSGAVLTCTPNPRPAVAGVAMFVGCSINLAGTGYQLRATAIISGNTFTVDSDPFTIVAANQPPLVAAGSYEGAEGSAIPIDGATAIDPDDDPLTFGWTYTPASGVTHTCMFSPNPPNVLSPSITCNDDGSGTLTLTVSDGAGHTVMKTAPLIVNNVAPSATGLTASSPVDEGSDISLSLAGVTDPSSVDAGSLSFAFDCGGGYGGFGSSNAATCPTTDNGTRNVRGKVRDKDGGVSGDYSATVTIENVAPTATFNAPEEVEEGTAIALSLTGADDASSVDKAAGFTYAFDCGTGAGYSSFGSTNTASCPTTDNATRTVGGKIRDKDGGTTEFTASVSITNANPIVSAGEDKSGNEGATIPLSGSFTDAGSDDTHVWEWDYVEGFNANATCEIAGATSTLTPTISCSDQGTVEVTLTVTDDDGGQGSDAMLLTLANVAPTATGLNATTPVNEGSDIVLSLAGPTDASSVDAASLRYAFDCGTGFSAATYAAANTTNSASCPTDDNGTRLVKGKVFDKDGGVSIEYSATVTIDNVAPTATYSAPSSVNEGSPILLGLTNPDDPSPVDEATGFTYAFDCGDGLGYGAFGSGASRSCPTSDNGTRAVGGKIRDKDGGVTEYTGSVQVANVPPANVTLTKPDDSLLPASLIVAGTLDIKVAFDDPGTGDTHTAQIQCNTGDAFSHVNGGGTVSSGFPTSCTYPAIGPKVITVRVTDDDDGSGTGSHSITVKYNFDGFFAPVDRPNTYNVSKAGQAIPLKWRLTDALGRPVTDMTGVTVQSVNLNCSNSSQSDLLEEYAAGSSGLQNLGNGNYQFNWKTPTSYAGTCKGIQLVFGAGQLIYTEGPHAFFTFKK